MSRFTNIIISIVLLAYIISSASAKRRRRRGCRTPAPPTTVAHTTKATRTESARSTRITEIETTEGACSTAKLEDDIRLVSESIDESIAYNPNLIAGYSRAAFHDCIMAVPNNPTSGCNGSLRLSAELIDINNARLYTPIAVLRGIIAGTCVSMADAIQLASAIAIRSAGGPDVISDVVNASSPRVDATQPDDITEVPLPTMTYAEQEEYYITKGFTVTDMVASVAAGHSIGSFGPGARTFTPDRNVISPNFAWNLVERAVFTGRDAPGFHTLQSDIALISSQPAMKLLKAYSFCAPAGSVCATGVMTGLKELNADFAIFLIKLSRLSGVTVGRKDVLSAGL